MKELKAKLKRLLQRSSAAILWHFKYFWPCYLCITLMAEFNPFYGIGTFIIASFFFIIFIPYVIKATIDTMLLEGFLAGIKEFLLFIGSLPEPLYRSLHELYPLVTGPTVLETHCDVKIVIPDYWLLGHIVYLYVFLLLFYASYKKKYFLFINALIWYGAMMDILDLCTLAHGLQ